MKKGFFGVLIILSFGLGIPKANAAPLVDKIGEFLDSFPLACQTDCVDQVALTIDNRTSKDLDLQTYDINKNIPANTTSEQIVINASPVCLFCELGPENQLEIQPKHLFANVELKVVDEHPILGGYSLERTNYLQEITLEVYEENNQVLIRIQKE